MAHAPATTPITTAQQTLSTGGAVLALISSMLLVGASFGAVAPLVSAILEIRGFSEYFTGRVTAILAVGIAVASPWVGRLVERHGTRRINTLGIIGKAAGFASRLILSSNKTWAAATFTMIGAAVGGSYPTSLKIMGDRTPPEKLSIVNARFSTTYGYASLAGPIIAAFGIDIMESFGYLGWAVPGLAGLTLAGLLALVWWDRKFRPRIQFRG